MTTPPIQAAIVIAHDGRPYLHEPAGLETTFVADMPGGRPASYAQHTGHALVVAYLRAMAPGAEDLARVRLPSGRILDVLASRLCSTATLAARRILPAPVAARRRA